MSSMVKAPNPEASLSDPLWILFSSDQDKSVIKNEIHIIKHRTKSYEGLKKKGCCRPAQPYSPVSEFTFNVPELL